MNIAGGVLIICAALWISFRLTSQGIYRIEAIEAVCKLVTYIKQNIDTFGTPVDTILLTYKCDILDGCAFGEIMRSYGIFEAVTRRLIPLCEMAQSDFETFAENIGKGYRDEELKRCDYYLSRFEACLFEEREKFLRYRPMYRYLPILGALSVVLLLI